MQVFKTKLAVAISRTQNGTIMPVAIVAGANTGGLATAVALAQAGHMYRHKPPEPTLRTPGLGSNLRK